MVAEVEQDAGMMVEVGDEMRVWKDRGREGKRRKGVLVLVG